MNDRSIRRFERATRVGLLRGPVGKQEVIKALSEDFKDLARTARAIVVDEPAFSAAAYRHPATSVETPVATHADSLLRLLEDQPADTPPQLAAKAALRAKFTAYELPADSWPTSAPTATRWTPATRLQQPILHLVSCVLQSWVFPVTRLDAAVKNKYARDPEKLAAWKSASHTARPDRKAAPPEAPTSPAQ